MLLLGIATTSVNAQVTIGSSEEPAQSAVLDLNTGGAGNLGLLLPRVALTSDVDAVTIHEPAAGLMVYADGTGGLPAGVYVWDGEKWQTNATASGATLTVDVPVTSFSLNTPLSVERWKTGKLSVSAFYPEDATLPYIRWQPFSGVNNIGEITASLTEYAFTAEQPGTTIIKAISLDGCVSVDGTITIWQNYVSGVTVTNSNPLRLTIGDPVTALTATVTPADATRKTLSWTSETPSVASVSGSGDTWTVSELAVGNTTITASATDESGKLGQIACEVYPKINQPADISVTTGAAAQAMAVPATTPAHTYQLTDFEITSSNTSVVSYDKTTGMLTFGSAGTATLTVKFPDYDASQTSFGITVKSCTAVPTLSGNTNYTVNKNATQSISVTANGNGNGDTNLTYQWQSSTNGSSGWANVAGTSASYTVPTGTAGTIYYHCLVTNSCGTSTSGNYTVTVRDCTGAPAQPGSITIPTKVTTGVNFQVSISAVSGATGYTWNTPSGLTVVSGQGTSTITYKASSAGSIASGAITVYAYNDCGNSTTQKSGAAITVVAACTGTTIINGAYSAPEYYPNMAYNTLAGMVKYGGFAVIADLCVHASVQSGSMSAVTNACSALNSPTNLGWRVPNAAEAANMYEKGVFTEGDQWTSTKCSSNAERGIGLGNGIVYICTWNIANTCSVRCVRTL